MQVGRLRLPDVQYWDKTLLDRTFAVRAKSKWTPEGIVLWLIAAVLATLIVWSQTRPTSGPQALPDDVEVEVEFVE
jgi:hypothetical protein